MRFFERLITPRVPEDPIEGALKLLRLSQLVTMPMTLSMDLNDKEDVLVTNRSVNLIHFAALLTGLGWGVVNCLNENRVQERELARP